MQAHESLAQQFLHRHPAEAADALSEVPSGAAARVLGAAPLEDAAALLSLMSSHRAPECASEMPAVRLAQVVGSLPPHAGANLLRLADDALLESVLAGMPHSKRARVEAQLRYPPSSVGESMDTRFPAVQAHWSLGQLREVFPKLDGNDFPYVYVVDQHSVLVGVIAPGLDEPDETPLKDVMTAPVETIYAFATLESVLHHPGWTLHDRLPVTSAGNVLVGTLRHRDLRRLRQRSGGRTELPMADALLTVSELCWGGLWNAIDGFAAGGDRPPRPAAQGNRR